MPDYGHALEFGVFTSPDVHHAATVLELAQLADVRGLDLVTVQDHPYNAAHLDALTLLTTIAARTSQVRVAPNVVNLPLRPPVVLARSLATLDLLSGGRAELGLGAGAFWDAIAAAGGQRRTPKQAVDALVEAIGVIRGVWGTGTVREVGEHYQVAGLHAGPQPAHDIAVWLGAYGPRMLRVTGRLADGWLPSMGYADPPALAAMNAAIDEAALEAGRSPVDIRRLYNVTPGGLGRSVADWAEQLAGLALDEGMATFILAADEPDLVRVWADEVAPRVRELVLQERSLRAAAPAPAQAAPTTAATSTTAPPGSTRPTEPTEPAGPATDDFAVVPTPDDGVRVSAERAWDDATRPTAAGADHTSYSPQQQAAGQHLIDVHDHLRSELTQLRDVLDQVRRGHLSVGAARSVVNTMTMRQNNWTLGAYCESYCRIVTGHHGLEDAQVFPHLRAREPALVPVIDRLEEEHHVIHDLLERVDRALVALVGDDGYGVGGAGALDELQGAVDLLSDALLSHLSYEERELVRPLSRVGFY